MKAGMSLLNPNAKSYVPLSRRGAAEENKSCNLNAKDHQSSNENSVGLGTTENHKSEGSENSRAIGVLPTIVHDSFGSSSHNPCEITERQALNEDFDMDLAYLQMTFPGTSEECISYVYLANGGDLETTIDLLSQLEVSDVESPGQEDVSICCSSSSSSGEGFLKLKKVAVVEEEDGSTSTSSSSGVVAAAANVD